MKKIMDQFGQGILYFAIGISIAGILTMVLNMISIWMYRHSVQ